MSTRARYGHSPAGFKARRLASAIRYLNAALGELEEAHAAPSGQATLVAGRRVLIADFRVAAANAGWEPHRIEEVAA